MISDETGSGSLVFSASPSFTGTITITDGSNDLNIASHDGVNGLKLGGTLVTASAVELNYVKDVTSAIQTQLNAKQATITGAATTISGADLAVSKALISNSSGKVGVSTATDTELGHLSGVTSAIQTQLDGKAPLVSPIFTGTTTIADGSNDLNIASHDGVNGLKLGGTLVTASAAELNTYILNVALDNISNSTPSCFVVAPKAGMITKIISVINGAITGADSIITASVNGGTAITPTITIAHSGSVGGHIDTCVPTANNSVTQGQYIKLTSDGLSGGAVKAVFTIEITY